MAADRKILVPTDFSLNSLDALRYASELSKHTGAHIVVQHVIETFEHSSDVDVMQGYIESIKQQVELRLEECRKRHSDLHNVPMSAELSFGKIHHEINRVAKEIQADYIVMGTHGKSTIQEFSKFLLGSNAYRTVNSAPCPIITVRRPVKKVKFKKIVLPLDLSKITDQKVDKCIAWAKEFEAEVHVVSVYDFLGDLKGRVESLNEKLDEVIDKLESHGIETEAVTFSHKEIAKSISNYAEEEEADLIIIMTREESRIDGLIMGGKARKLIERTKIPVMTLHPDKV